MAIKEKFVETIWTKLNRKHFESLGYFFNGYRSSIRVKTEHLASNSCIYITAICDKCSCENSVRFYRYRDLCKNCFNNRKTDTKTIDFKYIKEKFVKLKWSSYIKSYYVNVGYVFTKMYDFFEVNIKDLNKNSHAKITAICSKCGKERFMEFRAFSENCKDCQISILWMDDNYRKRQAKSVSIAAKKYHSIKRLNGEYTLTEAELRAKRAEPKIVKWSKDVKIRDNFKCILCDSNKNLNSHHLMSFTSFPELSSDLDNGVCLCKKCHKEFHSKYGIKRNTKEQFEEFKFYKLLNKMIYSITV